MEAFAAAKQANIEIRAAMRKLALQGIEVSTSRPFVIVASFSPFLSEMGPSM